MEPLAVVTRNGLVESIHYGLISVTDSTGNLLYSIGDPKTPIFFRSSAKPFQVIPLIESGGAEEFHFVLKDIALACSSHSGQDYHRATASSILKRLDMDESFLKCGTMTPYNEKESKRLLEENLEPSLLHCSCSGKHAAMLALSKYRKEPLDSYFKMDHPIQREILKVISTFSDINEGDITTGIDGCGAPIFVLPISKTAQSYGRLMEYAYNPKHQLHKTCKTIVDAMTAHPEYVAGDGEFTTELMKHTNKKLIGKDGCEALFCIGIKGNIGITIKIADGSERALYPVILETLMQMEVLDEKELELLRPWHKPLLKNNLNEGIGQILPVFDLKRPSSFINLLGNRITEEESLFPLFK